MSMNVTHSRRAAVTAQVEALGVVAVIRLKDPAKLRAVVDAIAEGGVRALEVTVTVPATARAVIDAGASFVVGPVFRPDVIAACHERDVPAMPGCFSPTEILAAHESGADIVKVFPATMLGPQFIKDVRAPMPQVKLMPTGGVTLDNAGDWIRAGAVAVGLGSALLDAAAIESGRLKVLTANAQRVVENIAAARRLSERRGIRSHAQL